MLTLLVTPPGPPTQKYQKLGSPGTKWAHNLHAGGFRHGEKDSDSPGAQKATKRLKKSILNLFFHVLDLLEHHSHRNSAENQSLQKGGGTQAPDNLANKEARGMAFFRTT